MRALYSATLFVAIADLLAVRREHGAVLGLEHEAVRGRSRVAARAAVGRQARLHAPMSTSG